ncbi:MAG TPA: hypothetical protein PK466_08375 [Thermotogota bacterium]|nr:hypothetical protein [Thermotogota bacterium]
MNIERLKEAEQTFLSMYPLGFKDPEMEKGGKKHRMEQMVQFAHDTLNKKALKNEKESVENIIKLVSRSSMVSVFEKPRFKEAINAMNGSQKKQLVSSIGELIHGDEEKGFNELLELLVYYKMGKWTLMTVFRCYYYPDNDLLYKPTTVKGVINKFELEGLVYKPRPSYDFFVKYRDAINEMKTYIDPSLKSSNAAFSGFLMMTM